MVRQILNVIKTWGDSSIHVESFIIEDNENRQTIIDKAEDRFIQLIEEIVPVSKEEKESFIEDGFFENFDTKIYLTWFFNQE